MSRRSRYPEHEKLAKIKDQSQSCGLFFDWLQGRYTFAEKEPHQHEKTCFARGFRICNFRKGELVPVFNLNVQKLLAEFFRIDQKKIDAEKETMLKEIRAGRT